MKEINKIFKGGAIQQFFKSQPINKAYLFGSVARGDDRFDSDIDIMVELDKNTDMFQFIGIKLQLEKIFNKTVDLISSNGISPHLKPFIDKDKILIYEK